MNLYKFCESKNEVLDKYAVDKVWYYVIHANQTQELWKYAFEKYENFKILKKCASPIYLVIHFYKHCTVKTIELDEIAVKNYYLNIKYVTNYTPEIIKLAIRQNGLSLKYIDEKYLTDDIYKYALQIKLTYIVHINIPKKKLLKIIKEILESSETLDNYSMENTTIENNDDSIEDKNKI